MLLAFSALAASGCHTRVVSASHKAVSLTSITFDGCEKAVDVSALEIIGKITDCRFISCISHTDNAAVGFCGLGLTIVGSSVTKCESVAKCSAVGANRSSSDLTVAPQWEFRDNSITASMCASCTCRFDGLSRANGVLDVSGINMTDNGADGCGSMFWIHSFQSLNLRFCHFDSNGDFNGLVFDDLSEGTSFSLLIFTRNQCLRNNRSAFQGLFYVSASATLIECVFADNLVECFVSDTQKSLPIVRFERCMFDDHAFLGEFDVVTMECKGRHRQLLAPWPNRTPAMTGLPELRTRQASLIYRPSVSRVWGDGMQTATTATTYSYSSGGGGGSKKSSGIPDWLMWLLIIGGIALCGGGGGKVVMVVVVDD
jgi:hypothetical protein